MTQPQVERSADQLAHEQAMAHVSAVLTNLDGAIERARKGQRELNKTGQHDNVELALVEAADALERARKRLLKDTYFAGDAIRLI